MIKPPDTSMRKARSQPFSEEECNLFHVYLDILIDMAEDARTIMLNPGELDKNTQEKVLWENSTKANRVAAFLMSKVFGNELKMYAPPLMDPRRYIGWVIECWRPAFPSEMGFWSEVALEIAGLEDGNEPEILRLEPRPKGAKPNRTRLATMRVYAVIWSKYLKSKGVKPSVYQKQISAAFGTDWDTIRRWPERAKKIFGNEPIDFLLDERAYIDNAKPEEELTNDIMLFHPEVVPRILKGRIEVQGGSDYLKVLAKDGNQYRKAMGMKQEISVEELKAIVPKNADKQTV